MARSDGAGAGMRAPRTWREAAIRGLRYDQAAAQYPELKKSTEKLGKTG